MEIETTAVVADKFHFARNQNKFPLSLWFFIRDAQGNFHAFGRVCEKLLLYESDLKGQLVG